MTNDQTAAIAKVCAALAEGGAVPAERLARQVYPYTSVPSLARRTSTTAALRVFRRDGFVDRYSGARLLFPGVLRVLSIAMPAVFPFHPNWKMSHTHQAYWELMPTLDHVMPVARGGQDEFDNLVTTSMLRNAAKANWTLEELGWKLRTAPVDAMWDGLTGWFLAHVGGEPGLLTDGYVKRWYRAASV